jgi:hypothetical protein
MSHIVYATGTSSVTIDYNATLQLFLTQGEQLSFSAQKLLQMLNRRAGEARVRQTGVGLRVFVGEGSCVLTQRATTVLADLYRRSRELQVDFPALLRIFPCDVLERTSP